MSLQQVASTSHDVKVGYKNKTSAVVTVDGEATEVGNRDFILRYQLSGGEIASGLLVHEAEKGGGLGRELLLANRTTTGTGQARADRASGLCVCHGCFRLDAGIPS